MLYFPTMALFEEVEHFEGCIVSTQAIPPPSACDCQPAMRSSTLERLLRNPAEHPVCYRRSWTESSTTCRSIPTDERGGFRLQLHWRFVALPNVDELSAGVVSCLRLATSYFLGVQGGIFQKASRGVR